MLVKSTRCYGTKIIESLRNEGTVIGLTVRSLDKSIHETTGNSDAQTYFSIEE